jgi:hypothetical protein
MPLMTFGLIESLLPALYLLDVTGQVNYLELKRKLRDSNEPD